MKWVGLCDNMYLAGDSLLWTILTWEIHFDLETWNDKWLLRKRWLDEAIAKTFQRP